MSSEGLNSPGELEVVNSLVTLLHHYLPSDWTILVQKYRALGQHSQTPAMVWGLDNQMRAWRPPAAATALFDRLRQISARPGRGAWLSMDLTLRFPEAYEIAYFWDEDAGWGRYTPGSEAFRQELERFPRDSAHIPDWFQAGLDSNERPPTSLGERFRMARPVDQWQPGRPPVVNRNPLPAGLRQPVLDYLESAPICYSQDGMMPDLFDPDFPNGPACIPHAWHTDGTWIWPAQVPFFLRNHNVSPEADLVTHISFNNYELPTVDQATLEAAEARVPGLRAAKRQSN
ncbi:hypothetical protein [Nocardia sp. NPDC051832]|uniref:hypothetical protein n=1 Tax=Nocardia sp. NPDC051832 TaxID=3155673 RepID=UPI003416164B